MKKISPYFILYLFVSNLQVYITCILGADIEKRDFVRCIRPHEWARLCGWNSTAKVIRRVGSVGAWSFKREELKKGKEVKSSIFHWTFLLALYNIPIINE